MGTTTTTTNHHPPPPPPPPPTKMTCDHHEGPPIFFLPFFFEKIGGGLAHTEFLNFEPVNCCYVFKLFSPVFVAVKSTNKYIYTDFPYQT
jgi:hypothetical protein